MLPERLITRASGCRFEALPPLAIHMHIDDAKRNVAPAADFAAEGGPGTGGWAQPMVDVDCVKVNFAPFAQARKAIEQNDGIETAAQRSGEAGTGMQPGVEASFDLGREFGHAITWRRLP
jgi:hypothetical protein